MSPVPATRTSWPGAQRLAAYAALVFVPLCATSRGKFFPAHMVIAGRLVSLSSTPLYTLHATLRPSFSS